MKIILLKDIAKIGKRYDIKEIKDGYALNFLIPNKLAIPATNDAIKRIELNKNREDTERRIKHSFIIKNLEEFKDKIIEIKAKTNDKGHLFAGLHKQEIAKEIEKQTGFAILPDYIKLNNPIKEKGEYKIEIDADGEKAFIRLHVLSSS